jgi:type VI protein secretion system component VasK
MAIKEKSIYLRMFLFFIGAFVLTIVAVIIEDILRMGAGIVFAGVIPKLLLYGVPIVLLGYWLGIWKSKRGDTTIEENDKPSNG